MSEKPAGEKSFAPTDKRKRDATKKGDVLRSKEVATAVAVMAGGLWLMQGGPWLMEGLAMTARASFTFEYDTLRHFAPANNLALAGRAVLPPILVLGLIVIIATVASQLLLGDGRFVVANAKPKGSRINPLSGLKRIFGVQGLIELGKSLLKITLLGAIAAWWAKGSVEGLLALGHGNLYAQLHTGWDRVTQLVLMLAAGLVIIAMIDWPIQYVRRTGRLKMTYQEMRDETKQTEGSPEKRAAQRQRQRDLARGGVARAVKEAQFVLTNPTHFTIAMTYDPDLASAPVVLAKGRGDRALAMRELAAEYDVPMLEYPMLARSVYFTTRENQVIREELYVAIAALVAFVLSLKRGEHPPSPRVDVPVALRFDSDGRILEQ